MRSDPGQGTIQIALQSDPVAVRAALKNLFHRRRLRRLQNDQRGTAELVLAEVLNNVVEHAYAGTTGRIEVRVGLGERAMTFTVVDHGIEMPGHTLPDGILREYRQADELPEGGFGWYMIRILAKEVGYRRCGTRNELSFRLDLM
jgi:serine/threonine-protein kinase RsbW